jgi:hypothetical protein
MCFLCSPCRDIISSTSSESKFQFSLETAVRKVGDWFKIIVGLGVSYYRAAVAEAPWQFGNPEEGKRPPLEAVTRELVKTQQVDMAQACAVVNCIVC